MKTPSNYLEINRASWNARTAVHVDSDFYDMSSFLSGKSTLKSIELELLGDVHGKEILHLQCHFGQDTLSLARMGAKATGVDLSDAAIAKAKELNDTLGLDANFVCCDLYSLPEMNDRQYDIVFTSYGTIGWLPDLDKWASVVKHSLKPGGRFILVEFHPVVWMFDNDFTRVAYNYFNADPIIETETGTYADKSAAIEQEYITWNHPLSDVFTALRNQGLHIETLREYDYSPYDCFSGTKKIGDSEFIIEKLGKCIPMTYAIVASK
ncbi:MAG: class I SAM-dependent methyltransferase [Flavobacteriaceae bacterium]|nr:class I SAM-dependent methyltransferase [Flavobacteriaceae bacterium]